MSRWFFFLLTILVGFALGLFYTWQINPIEYTDARPETLRVDYKTDYVLMVAEIYQQEEDIQEAIRRLTQLELSPSDVILTDAITFAEKQGYQHADIAVMRALLVALESQAGESEGQSP